jgi:hypothetical protein
MPGPLSIPVADVQILARTRGARGVPLPYVGGNIDLTDYSHILPSVAGHDNDPSVLMKTYINETELNNYPYAFMRSGHPVSGNSGNGCRAIVRCTRSDRRRPG